MLVGQAGCGIDCVLTCADRIRDVKTGFLTERVIGLWKLVIYRLPDYVTSHVTWLIVCWRLNVSVCIH